MLLPLDTIAVIFYLGNLAILERGIFLGARPDNAATGQALLLATVIGAFAVFLLSAFSTRLTLYLLEKPTTGGSSRKYLASSLETWLRITVVLLFVALTETTYWPAGCARALDVPVNEATTSLLGILPFLLFTFCAWVPLYRLHVRTMPGRWTMGSYLLHKVRYSLFILGIWAPLMGASQFALNHEATIERWLTPFWLQLAGYVLMGMLIWVFPRFLRLFWGCQRLEDGPLRDRILQLEKKAGVHFSEICVWDLGGDALINAAAVGIFAPFRYLFLSRALIANLAPDELDSVICHEMGHVRHRHLLFYFVSVMTFMGAVQMAMNLMPVHIAVPGLILGIIVFIRFVFAFASRRFERQADLTALDILGQSGPLRRGLERIALASGNIRLAPSWHHMSIAERTRFLLMAEREPGLGTWHHAQVALLKRSGYLLAILFALGALLQSGTAPIQPPRPPRAHGLQATRAHWLRIRELIPDSPAGALALASLALDTKESGIPLATAQQYALEGKRKARTREEHEKADRLLRRLRERITDSSSE